MLIDIRVKFSHALRSLFIIFICLIVSCSANAIIKSFKQNAEGIFFYLDRGQMQIKICSADIIEIRYTLLDSLPLKTSLVISNKWTKKINFTVSENKENIVITTNRLKLLVDKSTNAITYLDHDGKPIISENKDNNKVMVATTIAGIHTYNCITNFNSASDEALYGLGCHPEDSLSINYKGRNQDMAIKYLTGAIPVLLSTKGYGLLWDNYAASAFYGSEAGNTQFKYQSESGQEIDYYFFYGPDFDHIIDLYRTTTGRAPMFPKWAFGLFQSQDRYKTQAEMLSVKNNYRDNHIPVDAIVQDWFYWEPLPIGTHVMNPNRYPDPKAMIDELHQANFHAMISIWPVFGAYTTNFEALKNAGALTSITWDNFVAKTFDTYYDAHDPTARDLYWAQARDKLIKPYGWDAWWVDQCEPDNGSLLDERRKAEFSVGKGINYFNTYSLEHSKGLYKNWRKDIPGKRAFFLIRQSFAGEQRNAATLWSSDITTTFAALKNQIPQAINACVSGIPYWASDIGGYMSRVAPEGIPDWSRPEYRELFIRWFQFGVFSPIFRIHGKGERALFSKNWDDTTKAILLKYDDLRYRLLPYIYSLSAAVTRKNYTILRSLAFDFRSDRNIYDIPDQYMFGPAFLVNPVTQKQHSDKNTRTLYLPATTNWYDFYTGKIYQGGKTITASAPLDIIPLYVRAGSIVPMGPVMEYATEKPSDTIELRIYPGANGQFEYYEDENDNYNYEKGSYAICKLSWNDQLQELHFSDTKGQYPGMIRKHVFNIVLVKDEHGSNIETANKIDKAVIYLGKAITVKL